VAVTAAHDLHLPRAGAGDALAIFGP
jgi:hypothetical protein